MLTLVFFCRKHIYVCNRIAVTSAGSITCAKPSCSGRCRQFANEKSLGMHLERSQTCYQFYYNNSAQSLLQTSLLCFDAWLMQDTFWMIPDLCGTKSSAKASIEKLMQMCQTNIPVIKQDGW